MKAVLFALGSRGDIEPLFSLGESLAQRNWDVTYVFPLQFKDLVESHNAKFVGFTKEFIEVLLASENSKKITSRSGSAFGRAKTLYSLAIKSLKINKEVTIQQKKVIDELQPDYVFFNQKCVYPVVWAIQNEGRSIFVHPFPCFLHQVDDHSIIGFSGGGNYGKFLNRLSYFFQSYILSLATYFTTKNILKNEGSFKTNPSKIRNHLLKKIKSIYTVSPLLFSKPQSWKENVEVVGFVERDKSKYWEPDEALSSFLETYKNEKIFFVTFGSISNLNPELKTKTILNIVSKYNVPLIVNTSWGGLLKLDGYPKNIIFVNRVPYDWIFPKVYGVIHHGGAGTTHTTIKYGCASLIIPHFIDQFYWNRTIAKLNLGPKGISIKKLNEDNFEEAFLKLKDNLSYKENAERLSLVMKEEFDADKLVNFMKCSD